LLRRSKTTITEGDKPTEKPISKPHNPGGVEQTRNLFLSKAPKEQNSNNRSMLIYIMEYQNNTERPPAYRLPAGKGRADRCGIKKRVESKSPPPLSI
jgi:hypothetical protein